MATERLMDPRVLIGGQFSIRKFFEAHAYSGTEFLTLELITADSVDGDRYAATCECGEQFGPMIGDEDLAHAELLELYSGHVAHALLGQLLISLTESLVADKTQKRPGD